MNIQELYSSDLLRQAYVRLQEVIVPQEKGNGTFITAIKGPEVISDKILANWLALNYLYCVDHNSANGTIMGEIGGIMPQHPEDHKKVLAISIKSVEKVVHGINMVREAEKTGKKYLISKLEADIETVLGKREGMTIVDGNRNYAHYDFLSAAGVTDPMDLLQTNGTLLLRSTGVYVLSNKCLDGELYVFNVPFNKPLFEKLAKANANNENEKLRILQENQSEILPPNFIAGFHIKYGKSAVSVMPLISESECAKYSGWLQDKKYGSTSSEICHLGTSGPNGRFGSIGIMGKMLLENKVEAR